MNYAELSDEALVSLSKDGDRISDEFLYERYKNIVRMKARPYFLMGADREDLVQEGMIGFYKAIRDYSDSHGASFRSFAEICITRQLISAIKSATRQKHMPLNTYVSIYKPVYEDDQERSLIEVISEMKVESPEDTFIVKESLHNILKELDVMLSPLEKQVLSRFLDGKSYVEIAYELGRGTKAVDNALQRVKRKLERILTK